MAGTAVVVYLNGHFGAHSQPFFTLARTMVQCTISQSCVPEDAEILWIHWLYFEVLNMSDIPFSVEVHTVYQEKTLSAFRKVIEDKQLYYAPKVKLCQELCEARTVDGKLYIVIAMSDCGVPDVREMGISLIIKTTHHEYRLKEVNVTPYYQKDNKMSVFFTLPQILPITHCQLYINWIQYWSDTLADKHIINEAFKLTSEEESKSIRRINRFWNGCGACRCGNKANLTDEKKENAWKEYPELKADFDSLKRLLSEAKKIKLNLSTCNNTKKKKEQIAVPINCYFDKGFYAAIYYTKGCEILKIQLSAGKSAIQCIIGVDKDNLDLLAYLYYCTITQRRFFQYMTEEQKNLKDYLEDTHPIMKLSTAINSLLKKYEHSQIIDEANVFVDAQEVVAEYYDRLKTIRNTAYEQLAECHKIQNTWVSEYKLYMLVKIVFPDAVYQFHSEWLENQSLDIYIPSIKCGIEYQGEQHYLPSEYYGGVEKLEEQKRADDLKREKCDDIGVTLIEWKYSTKINFQAVCSALKCVAPVDFFDEQKLQERIEKYPVKDMTDFLLPD